MVGGGLKSMLPKKNKELYMILAGLVIILLKVFAVQWSYNLIWPKISYYFSTMILLSADGFMNLYNILFCYLSSSDNC